MSKLAVLFVLKVYSRISTGIVKEGIDKGEEIMSDKEIEFTSRYLGFVSMSDTCLMMMFSPKLFSF